MLNKVMLIGRLGSDPEMRTTTNGKSVANFNIATTKKFKDSSGNKQEQTEWSSCVCWDRLAEICSQYLRKGSLVYVEGSLATKKWNRKDGSGMAYRTEINLSQMVMLDKAGDRTSNQPHVQEGVSENGYDDGSGHTSEPPEDNDIPF